MKQESGPPHPNCLFHHNFLRLRAKHPNLNACYYMERDETQGANHLCPQCLESKPATIEHWPTLRGTPDLRRFCRLCTRSNKRAYDLKLKALRVAARTQRLAKLVEAPVPVPAKADKPVLLSHRREEGELRANQLAVVQALREGSSVLNKHSRYILSRFLRYVRDSGSPHHEWAMKLAMSNIMPRKLYEDLGLDGAGLRRKPEGREKQHGPVVHIHVTPAGVPTAGEPLVIPGVRVFDAEGEEA